MTSIYRLLLTLLAMIYLSAIPNVAGQPSLADRKDKIHKMDTSNSLEGIERKNRSEALLKKQKVPVNQHLPAIESEADSKRRSAEEVAFRTLALLVVAVKGEGLEQPMIIRLVKEYGLGAHLTPKEKGFLNLENPNQEERAQFTWRYEAVWTLLWALGYIDKLDKPTAICDVPKAVAFMKERSAKKFISDAKLRPLNQLLDEADLIYRYHWAIVDARLKNRPSPAGLEPGVVFERHYALNWLIGYMDQEWDDISTDT